MVASMESLQKKSAGVFILIATICLSVLGCSPNRITKYYDFTNIKKTARGVDINARLVFEYFHAEPQGEYQVTVAGSPYQLVVSLHTTLDRYTKVTVQNVQLVSNKGSDIDLSFMQGDEQEFEFSSYKKSNGLSFLVNGLTLEHATHRLMMVFELHSNDGSVFIENIEGIFEPQYREEKSNDGWSALMSV